MSKLNRLKSEMFGSIWRSALSSVLIAFTVWFSASLLLASQTASSVPEFDYQLDFVRNSQGENISLWYFPKSSSDEVILYLHGSTGRLTHFIPELNSQASIVSPAYPGYHESEGSPTYQKAYEAAVLAYDYLLEKGFSEDKITIFGHSMGGSPATYLAARRPNAKRLVIVNTFSSIQSMCFRSYTILCGFNGSIFNSAVNAKDVQIPVRHFAYKGDRCS